MDPKRGPIDLPALGGQVQQKFAGGGRPATDGRHRPGRTAAAGGRAVVGRQNGVGHDQADMGRVQPQFFRGSLGEFRAGALPHFDFARHDGDGPVAINMQAGSNVRRATPTESPAASPPPAALGQGDLAANRDQQPGPQHLDELAPREAPRRVLRVHRLVDFRIDAMIGGETACHDW